MPASQVTHGPPPRPQASGLGVVTQVRSGRQHPKRQLLESQRSLTHVAPEQTSSEAQARQMAPSRPQAVGQVPGWQVPTGSRHPPQDSGTQAPASQRSPAAHAAQKVRAGPHVSATLFAAQRPSGRQHEVAQAHAPPPASATPASTSPAKHNPSRHTSPVGHRAHALPPSPHAVRRVPSRQSPEPSQQPVQVDGSQGRAQPGHEASTTATTAKTGSHRRIGAPL